MYPHSSQGLKFIISTIEYFTKWVEAITLIEIKALKIVEFIETNLICRFGISSKLIMDNGLPFKNKDVQALCEKYHIQLSLFIPYYPQANGQVKASDKTIIKVLFVGDSQRDWHNKLSYALWAYRTSIRTPTKATSFSIIYGAEVILPIELKIPSLHISL